MVKSSMLVCFFIICLACYLHPHVLSTSANYIKGKVFLRSNREIIFFFSLLLYALFPLSLLYYHMSKGKIVGFLPEVLKASSVEQIC